MEKVGTTVDGKTVRNGVFMLVDTHGLPLDVIMGHLAKKNAVVSWVHFCIDAVCAGWTDSKIHATIREAVTIYHDKKTYDESFLPNIPMILERLRRE